MRGCNRALIAAPSRDYRELSRDSRARSPRADDRPRYILPACNSSSIICVSLTRFKIDYASRNDGAAEREPKIELFPAHEETRSRFLESPSFVDNARDCKSRLFSQKGGLTSSAREMRATNAALSTTLEVRNPTTMQGSHDWAS